MITVDSSGWVEYFLNGTLSERYSEFLDGKEEIVTPTVSVFEVFKVITRYTDKKYGLLAVEKMSKTQLVPLDQKLALDAAESSMRHGLSMADAIVYATAKAFNARFVTSDADFKSLPNVTYIPLEESA